MENTTKTEVVQAVVPIEVANEIRKDANGAVPAESVSRVTARILCAHYAKRVSATRPKSNRRVAA